MELTNSHFPSEIIDIDDKSSHVDSQKRSVKSYATKVFQESTIGMVSSIVTTHSKYRRFFKTFLLLICISGFFYQCIRFLNRVFEYPTTVDIDIDKPDNFTIPAYTFCANNAIKRSLFCSKYPDRCYEPSEKFCKKFDKYCGTNKTLIPKKEFYDLESSMSHEDILKYGDDLEDFYVTDRSETMNFESPSGPYFRVKNNEMTGAMICYSLHSVLENNQQPIVIENVAKNFVKPPIDVLTFYIDESEMFIPGNGPGVLFSIHSPYEAVNPFERGIFMKPGRTYKIHVEIIEEVLLKQPYETNCENYEESWERNNHTGPRIQEMCQHECLLESSLAHFNCVVPFILYPSDERICDFGDIIRGKFSRESYELLLKCWKNCRDDCKVTIYKPKVTERFEVDYAEDETLEDYHRYITVEMFLKVPEVMVLKHSPKYMTVEVFSNIGGFIGCWLGIALMDIVDVLASVFTVCRYAFRQKFRVY